MIRLPKPILFMWDTGNKDKNWLKHQVSNTEAEECFFDKNKRLVNDIFHSTDEEKRFILFGKTRQERLLFIVFTLRQDKIRIISARDVNQKERPIYEKAN